MGNGTSRTYALNGAIGKTKEKEKKVFSYVLKEDKLKDELKTLTYKGNENKKITMEQAEKVKSQLDIVARMLPGNLNNSSKGIVAVINEIDVEVAEQSKVYDKLVEKEMIPTIQGYISMKDIGSKLLHACMNNFLTFAGGVVCLGVGVVSVINEIGAIVNHTALQVPNIITGVAAAVSIYLGVKLIAKSGPSTAYLKKYKKEMAKTEEGEQDKPRGY